MLHNGFLGPTQTPPTNTRRRSANWTRYRKRPEHLRQYFRHVQLPKFLAAPSYERLLLGGWQLNSVARFSNGALINAPGNVNIIGNYYQSNPT